MNMYKIQGKLTSKAFKNYVSYGRDSGRMEFVLEVEDGANTQIIKFHVPNNRIQLLDAFEVGDYLDVDFQVKGKVSVNGEVWIRLEVYDIFALEDN